ncbi:MAG: hypothetical protein ABIP95_12800 [Pelobium sp.]
MKMLENKILSFENWSRPWTFHDFVMEDKTLTKNELNLFSEIWIKASDFELWNESDLILGSKASEKVIKKNYYLTTQAIANIVRAISYQWK